MPIIELTTNVKVSSVFISITHFHADLEPLLQVPDAKAFTTALSQVLLTQLFLDFYPVTYFSPSEKR